MAEDFIEDNTLEDNELDFTTNVNPVDYNDDAIQHCRGTSTSASVWECTSERLATARHTTTASTSC